jgi:hypothetical protein
MTYGNEFLLTQDVHHREAVVESEADEEATQAESPKAVGECSRNTCNEKSVVKSHRSKFY